MFSFDQIKELIELVSRHHLEGLEVERAGFRVKILGEKRGVPEASSLESSSRAASVPASIAASSGPSGASSPTVAAASGSGTSSAPSGTSLHVVTSPIVGTFYAAPAPDADVFVHVGDRVRKGQVLCIVEAMKLMNEIECDTDGIVAEIYPKNAQPVEYGEPLFGIRPD